ncbi:uncharacterized protein EI97DRAFT_228258 [Westerdykella ornata]|uniref:HECT-type E3 ubiquitin transferase n=1 Tax=Westerdykella ornata TaxID=318751 RepID=A0A6A6JTQ2_WESOR|nr:uncharacterized protein EI97DRAFT_228258 [Westerdykella ornata]KAF2279136.1 hypothetical protein EI97DRAFT_228258 [Westerdykella ornata]
MSSSRLTRSAARRTAGAANGSHLNDPAPPPPPPPPPADPRPPSRKRKAAAREPTPEQAQDTIPAQRARGGRSKRSRLDTDAPLPASRSKKGKAKLDTSMEPGPSGEPSEPIPTETPQASASARGKSGRKNAGQGTFTETSPAYLHSDPFAASATPTSSGRASRKTPTSPAKDVDMEETPGARNEGHEMDEDSHDEGAHGAWDEDDEDDFDHTSDPFRGLANIPALRAFTGIYSGQQARFRKYLEQLRSKDPSLQFIALQELSETLLLVPEDALTGNFPSDQFVKELVALMEPSEFGEENPNLMLLACRCLANLMEAIPAATANVVYGGAVPVLCSTLLQMQFIDVAEQCLSTLEKISVEFPASIVREGGLSASLSYLEFFHTSTQRTAVTTAANCCRNIPEDSFDTVRDVMPILKNILSNSDPKVVEQGCICISRIVQSFRHYDGKLEELVSPDLLEAILRLLLPGTTNLVGENIHTMFLQVLAYTARASPSRSAELFKMNIVETLFQILTGVSPPPASDNTPTKIDSIMVMQALIHRPKDQVYETLNVICELLPDVPKDGLHYLEGLFDAGYPGTRHPPLSRAGRSANETRIKLLEGCKPEVKRFAVVLFPTLTDAYSSTVNLGVRQKVLTAQLKMLSNLDVDILEEALRTVPYASYLAAIFSQQDHPSLVTYALQAAEILLARLGSIYRYQFYREGVISQISALAERPLKNSASLPVHVQRGGGDSDTGDNETEDGVEHAGGEDSVVEVLSEHEEEEHEADHDEEEHEHSDHHGEEDDDTESDSSSGGYSSQPMPNIEDIITLRARKFIELHENESVKEVKEKASRIMEELKSLANELRRCVLEKGAANCKELFTRLAAHFDGDALDGITTYELMTSGIVDVLLEIFEPRHGVDVRSVFLETFMGSSTANTVNPSGHSSPETPFSVLVSKLQDLLSRAEHFEVVTVHQSSYDGRASAASVLTKQVRLKLVGDEDSGVPKAYRNILVSIHAIATFKALDDYLRPRFSLAERPRSSNRDTLAAYAAALAGGRALPPPQTPQTPAESRSRSSTKKPSKSKPSGSATDGQAGSSSGAQQKPRRSSRRQQTQGPPPPPPPPPAPAQEPSNQEPLECADEERLSDEDSLDDQAALNALVDDLDDAIEEDAPDPSAVNVEVASTGKVTARKEDGTRIATPVQGQTPVRSSPAERAHSALRGQPPPSLAGAAGLRQALGGVSGLLSQVAAAQSTPSDFHLEFSINGRPIPHDTTIYRAVHFSDAQPGDGSHRTVWNAIHTINVRKVSGPAPTESSLFAAPESSTPGKSGLPTSLDQNPVASGILRLLSILHGLNCNLDDVVIDKGEHLVFHAEPLSQFVNPKLTAKLNRQLEEPLIVASNCLPSWSGDLARYFPFLFPFETRHLFLQSTAFGYSRAMKRWQNSQTTQDNGRHRDDRTAFLGRLQRQKIRVSRTRILESALKVMESFGSSPASLEIEYFDEVGTGLGPTLEFYSSASKEFSKRKLKLWRENETDENDEYAFGTRGLFPAPMSAAYAETEEGKRHLQLFKMLGKFVARSMLDNRIIDVSFNPTFFRIGDGTAPVAPSLGAVKSVDRDLARSLKLLKRFAQARQQIEADSTLSEAEKMEAKSNIKIDGVSVEDLGLDFTVPGYPIELIENGEQQSVTIDNVDLYVEKVIDYTLGCGVQRQVDAFRAGFSQVFDYSSLKAFTPDELVMLFGRVEEDWSVETLMDAIKADHGYNLDSKTVRNLLQVMSEYSPAERRDFLQFTTGSPKLPIGGFKKLHPMFTVVCKPSEAPLTSDDYLPSVMTCANYLKMPDYSTIDVLRQKLAVAIKEGQGAFHLS